MPILDDVYANEVHANVIRAKHVVVESGNGLHVLELTSAPKGVGLWITNREQNSGIAITTVDGDLHVGIHAKSPNVENTAGMFMDISLSAGDGKALFIIKDNSGVPHTLNGEDIAYLKELLDRQAEADYEEEMDRPPIAIRIDFRSDQLVEKCKEVEKEIFEALSPILEKHTGMKPVCTSLFGPTASTPSVDNSETE